MPVCLSELLAIVHQLPDQKFKVALVAHNPGLTEFCNYLSDADIAKFVCIDSHFHFKPIGASLSW